jgi:hypothetical protein
MYSLTLSDLDLTVSTTISTGDTIVGTGSFLGNDSSIVIPKNSDKEISVFYVFDTTPAENNIARQQCQSPTGVKYVTSGTVSMISQHQMSLFRTCRSHLQIDVILSRAD